MFYALYMEIIIQWYTFLGPLRPFIGHYPYSSPYKYIPHEEALSE